MQDLNNEEPRIIKTQDENGELHTFELVDILNVDGQDYGLLIYLDENAEKPESCECDDESECQEEEVVVMRLKKVDDAFTFETIEDDEEFNKVISLLEVEEDEGEVEE